MTIPATTLRKSHRPRRRLFRGRSGWYSDCASEVSIAPGHFGKREARGKRKMVKKHKVEFNAKRTVSKKVPVKFRTESGEKISFKARKTVKEPVHVKFMVKTK
jgi:hypothetical protein